MKKIFSILLVTAMVITGTIGASGIGVLAAAEKVPTINDIANMTQAELETLSSEQITQLTKNISKLSEKELSTIEQKTWDKVTYLWKRASSIDSITQLQTSLSKTTVKPVPINSPNTKTSIYFTTNNWTQYGGGGSGIYDWDSSASYNKNYVWTDATGVGYAYANAANGVLFSTSPWAANEAHEVDITFVGWTAWWMTTLGLPGTGTFEVKAYVYDATNQTFIGNETILSQNASVLYWWDEDYNVTVRTTLWADRDYIVFINSNITSFAFFLVEPGYCQSVSDNDEYYTEWDYICLTNLN